MIKQHNALTKAALVAVFASTALGASFAASAADKPAMEKCYGVAAAAHNDCATASNSCAGTVKKDRGPDAFIAVPEGLCQKIAGGTTKPAMEGKEP